MNFWRQLRFLLWKNFLIRKRQKIWIAIELIWPLILFLILVWVRGRNVYERYHECHYAAKALPSAGFLPFLQSYFCTFQNTCHKDPFGDDDVGKVNDYEYSVLSKIGKFVEEFLNEPDADQDFAALLDPAMDLLNLAMSIDPDGDLWLMDVDDLLSKAQPSINRITDAIKRPTIQRLLNAINSFRTGTNSSSNFYDDFVTSFTCGRQQSSQNMLKLQSARERIREKMMGKSPSPTSKTLNEMLRSKGASALKPEVNVTVKNVCDRYTIESNIDEKCAVWLGTIVPKGLVPQLLMILRGFILVSPKTEITIKMVEKLEQWLQAVDWIKMAVLDFYINADVYQDAIANSDLPEKYRKLLDIAASCRDFSEKCQQLWEFLNGIGGLFVPSSNPNATLLELRERIAPLAFMLQCFTTDRFRFVDTDYEMEKDAMCLMDLDIGKFYSGLLFDVSNNATNLPPMTTYKIRMSEDIVDGTFAIRDRVPKKPRDRPFIDTKYLYYGFSFLQDAVDRAIIELQTNVSQNVGIYAQQFPFPCYQIDGFIDAIERLIPQLMVMAWVFSAAMLTKNIVYEKEKRLKEFMKMMGLGNLVHWVAWFIQTFVVLLISVIFFVLIIKFGRIMQYSDVSVLLVFVLLFTLATITQCFFLSTLFGNANVAAAVVGLVYFLLYLPYVVLTRFVQTVSVSGLTASYLAAQTAFAWGCVNIADWENVAIGVNWGNVNKSPYGDDDEFTLGFSMWMMVADIFIHLILTWYIEAVFPGEYGIPKPFYFFLTKSYWWPRSQPTKVHVDLDEIPAEAKKFMEKEPNELALGVAVRNLKKIYPNGKMALSGVSLNFYESQITSFLGHNGAGKTTTLSIITGLFPPTDGTVLVYGRDVRTEIDEIRKSLGMCPQHNILYETLTVEEQLTFYAGLKGVSSKQIETQVKEMVEDLGLTAKAKTQAKALSGGTQRRLAVAAAFVGGSKTVILDEPTAGVDPCARRQIWDLLLRKKEGRTIILSTHFMDEADVLGDRIAIIGDGRLRCCGSSMFLKKCYGSGYRLTMVRKKRSVAFPLAPPVFDLGRKKQTTPSASPATTQASSSAASLEQLDMKESEIPDDTVNEKIQAFIQTSLPAATFVEDLGREFTYKLPSENPELLKEFFVKLESKMDEFHFSSYGVSETKLEEIFIKAVGSEGTDDRDKRSCWPECCPHLRRKFGRWRNKKRKAQNPIDDVNLVDSSDEDSDCHIRDLDRQHELDEHCAGGVITLRHLRALLTKRATNFSRNYKGWLCEIIAPIVMVAIVMYFLDFQPQAKVNQKPRPLVPWWYGDDLYTFFSLDNDSGTDAGEILRAMEEPPGLGIRCAKNQPLSKRFPCRPLDYNSTPATIVPAEIAPIPMKECRCDDRSVWNCPVGSYQPPPLAFISNTTDVIVNMTGRNISQWLLMTEEEFRGLRYAGFSLGEINSAAVENVSWTTVDKNLQGLMEAFKNISEYFHISWSEGHRSPTRPVYDPNSTFFMPVNAIDQFKMLLHGLQIRSNIKIWFNNQGWFALPAYANVLSNAMLRGYLTSSGTDPTEYGIVVWNHPMNYTVQSQAQFNVMRLSFEACMIILAFSIVPASFVLFIIEEDITAAKHLQFVSGVRQWLYWTSNFIWDMMNYLIPVFGCMMLFLIFNDIAYIGWPRVGAATFCLLLLYGFAIIPWMYPFSFVFRVPSVAFIMLTMGNCFIGWVSTITTMALERLGMDDPELAKINDVLVVVFLIFPQFCLGRGLMDLNQAYFMFLGQKFLTDNATQYDPFDWQIIGRNLFCLFLEGCVGFIVTLIVEYRRKLIKMYRQSENPIHGDEDEDVRHERERINAGRNGDNYALKILNLSKVYGRKNCGRGHPTRAVDSLCLGVKKGECFGLLGVNGAGKTTTFSMLTGKTDVTSGDALINANSILSKMEQVSRQIGYCPQSDALHSLLTGREELRFYARLKGVKSDLVEKVVSRSINQLGLKLYADRQAGTYSGGNKRKLSTAISLVGCPAVVLLDEPTTGMDPKARRFLWNRITEVVRDGKTSVILTSHSMEECEALCGRIGIMVNGRFRCLGSIQHLKSRFGQGYTLTIKIGGTRPKTEEAIAFIRSRFPGVELKEQHLSQLRFQLPPTVRALSDVFGCMIEAMKVLHVEDYTLSQTTLEQVFLSFAQEQGDDAVAANGAVQPKNGAAAL